MTATTCNTTLTLLLTLCASICLAQNARIDPQIQAEARAQSESAAIELHTYLNQLGYQQLAARRQTLAPMLTRSEAQKRQVLVKQQILALVGGLPDTSSPVQVQTFATFEDKGFRIENIIYYSAPDYPVTANVYIPDGSGPFPALVLAPGHGAGKSSQYSWGANFARAGYIVLAYDPMGQGERMQHFDAETGSSKLEPSGEHEHANQSALLLGQHIARYWFADGIRGVDYLSSRPDVDNTRIGTFGCSGGGTAAAYLAAADPRIKATAVASFITSFDTLLPAGGPQDAEQTLPGFLSSGLDFADWVELAAPRPYAIIAFEDDFFPYTGAQQSYSEASNFYDKFNAKENLHFISGAGGHCNLQAVTDQVLAFLNQYLQPNAQADSTFSQLTPVDADALIVTASGQTSTSTDSVTLEALLQADARRLAVTHHIINSESALQLLREQVQQHIRTLAAISADTTQLPEVRNLHTEKMDAYQLFSMQMESEPGITLDFKTAVPDGKGLHPVIILMDSISINRTAASAEFIRLVKQGNIVVAFQPRAVLGEPEPDPGLLALGQYMPELLRAIVVGKTLIGMRTDDTLRLLNWLAARSEVNTAAISLYGKGALGLTALHVAALDQRIGHVLTDNTLTSWRMALDAGLHKNLSEQVIPGVLRHYDTVELLQVISPRRVTLINPANAMGQALIKDMAATELSEAFSTDSAMGLSGRIKIVRRALHEPLPLE